MIGTELVLRRGRGRPHTSNQPVRRVAKSRPDQFADAQRRDRYMPSTSLRVASGPCACTEGPKDPAVF
jgi:hypothetical protein